MKSFILILAIVFLTPSCVWVSKSTEQGSVTGLMTESGAANLESTDAQADRARLDADTQRVAVEKDRAFRLRQDGNGSASASGDAARPFFGWGVNGWNGAMVQNPVGSYMGPGGMQVQGTDPTLLRQVTIQGQQQAEQEARMLEAEHNQRVLACSQAGGVWTDGACKR